MKTKIIITTLLLVFVMSLIQAQTPEDMAKIRRIQDSMMNLPQMKEMMQQLNDIQAQQEKEFNALKTNEKATVQETKSPDDWFWTNDWYTTTASKDNKFPNWSGGSADLTVVYMKNNQLSYLKVGTINANGSITLNFPEKVNTVYSLERGIGPQGLFFDINDNASFNYTNKDTGFLKSLELTVIRNDKTIGNLTMGNSVRVTHNLRDQSAIASGDEGYLLYWVYASQNCALEVNEDWEGKVRKDGTNTIMVKTNVNYNLNFKLGWNLVKTEVIGNYKLKHERGNDISWYKSHKHTVIATMPSDAIYFYRAIRE